MYYLRGNGWEDAQTDSDDLTGSTFETDPEVAIDAPEEGDVRHCPDCGEYIDEDAEDIIHSVPGEDDTTTVEGHEDNCNDPTWRAPESIGMHFNAAGVIIREDEDHSEVQVWISVGDPRGAFCMTLELVLVGEHKGELRLSLPTPADGLLHCPLTALGSGGYYKVN